LKREQDEILFRGVFSSGNHLLNLSPQVAKTGSQTFGAAETFGPLGTRRLIPEKKPLSVGGQERAVMRSIAWGERTIFYGIEARQWYRRSTDALNRRCAKALTGGARVYAPLPGLDLWLAPSMYLLWPRRDLCSLRMPVHTKA